MDKDLTDLFCKLVSIPSPSGYEKNAIIYVQNYLKSMGIHSYVDSAGRHVDSNSGNLIAKIGNGKPKIMFVAHMDTVEDGKKTITPIIRSGVIRSDRTTILGSDDKGGVAALLAAIKEIRTEKNAPTILCVFSIREEKGIMGVNYLPFYKTIKFVFDVDGSNPPGQFINKALGTQSFELYIYGKEAHAAANPEKGRNAIKASGIIVSRLKLGRDSKWQALNIGTISGGTRDNVIPGSCLLTGMARAFDTVEINKMIKGVKKTTVEACKATGCKYKLIKKESDPPLLTNEKSSIVSLARKASISAGIKFSLLKLPATIQGNALSAKGYLVLGLSKGGRLPHSKAESISINELEATKNLILEIVKSAKP